MYNEKIYGGGFHHIAMNAYDIDKTVRFYTEGLGFSVYNTWYKENGEIAGVMLESGDGAIFEIFPGGAKEQPTGILAHIALRTDDCDKAAKAVKALGAQITIEPKDIVINGKEKVIPARIMFFKGPDGETIELFQIK